MKCVTSFLLFGFLSIPSLSFANECVTFSSSQEFETMAGQEGNYYLVRIPSKFSPTVEGPLIHSVSTSNEELVFKFQVPASGSIWAEAAKNTFRVCAGVKPEPTESGRLRFPTSDLPPSQQLFAMPAPAMNQDTAGTPSSGADMKSDYASLDLSAPESPAFTVLGVTPETIVRPDTPRELASTLLNGFDQNGNYQTGFAIDTAPYLLLAGDQITLGAYTKSRPVQLASRFQFSAATTKGASDSDSAVRAALGFRETLWDRGDPRMDKKLIECFDQNLSIGFPIPPGPQSDETKKRISQREQELEMEAEKCREASRKRNWNASSWIVAAAPAWISGTGLSKNFRFDGGGVWTSFAYGFEEIPGLQDHAQFLFNARYRRNETVPDLLATGNFVRQDSTIFGGRLRFGLVDFNGTFEGAFFRDEPVGRKREQFGRYTIGAEKRLASNLWLNLSVSNDAGRPGTKSTASVSSNLKWNFSKAPKYSFSAPDQ